MIDVKKKHRKKKGNSGDYMVTTVSNEGELSSISPIAHIEMTKNHFLAVIASIEMIRYVHFIVFLVVDRTGQRSKSV